MKTHEQLMLAPALSPLRLLLRDHTEAEVLIEEAQADPTTLYRVVNGLDEITRYYNRTNLLSANAFHGYNFVPHVKSLFGKVPRPLRMLGNPTHRSTWNAYLQGIRDTEALMRRAENGEAEPTAGFHIWPDATTEQRLVGGTLQIYGMTIINLVQNRTGMPTDLFEKSSQKDHFLDALLEVAAVSCASQTDNAVKTASQQLGWYEATYPDGTHYFSDELRALANRT